MTTPLFTDPFQQLLAGLLARPTQNHETTTAVDLVRSSPHRNDSP